MARAFQAGFTPASTVPCSLVAWPPAHRVGPDSTAAVSFVLEIRQALGWDDRGQPVEQHAAAYATYRVPGPRPPLSEAQWWATYVLVPGTRPGLDGDLANLAEPVSWLVRELPGLGLRWARVDEDPDLIVRVSTYLVAPATRYGRYGAAGPTYHTAAHVDGDIAFVPNASRWRGATDPVVRTFRWRHPPIQTLQHGFTRFRLREGASFWEASRGPFPACLLTTVAATLGAARVRAARRDAERALVRLTRRATGRAAPVLTWNDIVSRFPRFDHPNRIAFQRISRLLAAIEAVAPTDGR